MTLYGCHVVFFVESFEGCGGGERIGHIKNSCHASCRGSIALRFEVGFLRQTWIAEMYVLINDAWKQVAAISIYHFHGRLIWNGVFPLQNLTYLVVIYQKRTDKLSALVNNDSILYLNSFVHSSVIK